MEVSIKDYCISLLLIVIFIRLSSTNSVSADHKIYTLYKCNESDIRTINFAQNVEQLLLNDCDFTKLENNTFERLASLFVLQSTNGKLKTLESSTFDGLKRLQNISLEGNPIEIFQKWSSENLIALSTLNLRRNRIQLLANDSFDCYPNLKYLDLSENLLKDLNENGFMKLRQLKFLDLGSNHLTHLSVSSFEGLERLTHLRLSHNAIATIEESCFESTVNLRSLMLEYNMLRSLEFVKVKSLERLMYLNLSHNEIAELDGEIFERNLDLLTLDLSWNFLANVNNNSFSGLHSLEHLNLSKNELGSIDAETFSLLSALKSIDLSRNELSLIPENIFRKTSFLERINLAHNSIDRISEALFSALPYLSNIDVSGNRLVNAVFTAHLHHSQLTLDLSNNLLREDAEALNITKLAELKHVNLADNNFSCSWLIPYIAASPVSINFGHDYAIPAKNFTHTQLNHTGLHCFDAQRNRSIIILQSVCQHIHHSEILPKGTTHCSNDHTSVPPNPSPPPLVWPKIRTDKFDTRSVIIWMLIAIAIAFTGLRVARHLMDEREGRPFFSRLKNRDCTDTEMEILHNYDDNK